MEPPTARAEERFRKSRRDGTSTGGMAGLRETWGVPGTKYSVPNTQYRGGSESIPDPAHRGPIVEDPRMRPRIVIGVVGRKDAHRQQGQSSRPTPAAAAQPIGRRQQRQKPQR